MPEAIVPKFDMGSTALYFWIWFSFAALIFSLIGLIVLSASNHVHPDFRKKMIETGASSLILAALTVVSSFVIVPQLCSNDHRRTEVVNAEEISKELTNETGAAYLVVEGNKYLKNYLIEGELFCDDYSTDESIPVFLVDESNILISQITLSFHIDDTNNSCSYVISG